MCVCVCECVRVCVRVCVCLCVCKNKEMQRKIDTNLIVFT